MAYVPVHIKLRFKSCWSWLISAYRYDMLEGNFFSWKERGFFATLYDLSATGNTYGSVSEQCCLQKQCVAEKHNWQQFISVLSLLEEKKNQKGEYMLKRASSFSSVQSLSRVQLFATPWTAARQASLFVTNSRSLLKLLSIKSVMPFNHLILCRRLLLPSIFPSIRVFSNESVLHIRWPKYWSFSFSPSNEYSGLISFRMDWLISLQSKGLSRVFSNTTVQKHQFFCAQLSL